jgi:hypothetical protein
VPIRSALLLLTAAVAAVSATGPPLPAGATYYVDCHDGNDAADGLSEGSAWKTVNRVSDRRFQPGDSIRFRRDTTCPGMLWPKGSGAAGAPITLSAYGVGPLPVIQSGPQNQAALRLFNQEYWRVETLEFAGGQPHGVWISGDAGILHDIHLKNIVVRDVTGVLGDSKESGLILVVPGAADQRFDGVIIDGATAYRTTQWAGIMVGGVRFGDPTTRSKNVSVRDSVVHDVIGDGIVLFRVNHGVVERSVSWHTGMQVTQTIGTPNAIWTWMCKDCVVQHNEAFLSDSPGIDGGAFDIDFGNAGNTVQANYGHDTQGYCVAVFGAGSVTTDSVVRDNVCVNNGVSPRLARQQGAINLYTWDGGRLDGVRVENNTIVWRPAVNAPAIRDAASYVGQPATIRGNVVRSTNGAPALLSPDGVGVENAASLDGVVRGFDIPRAAEPYLGAWLLLSAIDEGEESHSQTVMLRSVYKQFRPKGLRVVVLGAVPSNLAYDWHLEDIPVRPYERDQDASALPWTVLVSPDRKVVRRWNGFSPPADLGMTLRHHLGDPDFGQLEPPVKP